MSWRTWKDAEGLEHLIVDAATMGNQGTVYVTVCWRSAGAIFSREHAPTCFFCIASANAAEKFRGR